jgi:thiol-disulfide isomerase/thioredoxin
VKYLFLLLIVLGSGAGCTREPSARADCNGPSDCRPPLTATTLDGLRVGDEALAGKVVLVNFWATWCAPCKKELPALQAVYARHQGEGFTILGVVTGDGSADDRVKAFAASHGVAYPQVRGGPDTDARFHMGDALPTSYLYDRRGHLLRRWEGDIGEDDLDEIVKRALAL